MSRANMDVLREIAFGGDEREVIPVERGALQVLFREITAKRSRQRRRSPVLAVGDL